MKGQSSCLESGERWRLLLEAAKEFHIEVIPELLLEMDHNQLSPELAFEKVSQLIASGAQFTAVCAFNDTSAIGAIRALSDVGIACPQDVSVVGFDDIGVAGFYTPRLTTVRQPLEDMGRRAVEALIARIREPNKHHPAKVVLQPELIVRESTQRLGRIPIRRKTD
jgi:LacI family transcriptional regulator